MKAVGPKRQGFRVLPFFPNDLVGTKEMNDTSRCRGFQDIFRESLKILDWRMPVVCIPTNDALENALKQRPFMLSDPFQPGLFRSVQARTGCHTSCAKDVRPYLRGAPELRKVSWGEGTSERWGAFFVGSESVWVDQTIGILRPPRWMFGL